jgi:hypothetical protein
MRRVFNYLANNIYKVLFLLLGVLFIINFFQLNNNFEKIARAIDHTNNIGIIGR